MSNVVPGSRLSGLTCLSYGRHKGGLPCLLSACHPPHGGGVLGLKCLCFGEEPRHPPPPPPAAAGRGQCWAVRCWCRGHPSGAPGSGTLPCAAPAAGQPRPRGDRALAPLLLLNSRLRASLLWHYRAPVFLARVRLGHVRTRRRGGGG